MPQNLLVTGANGQLGNEMQRIVAANPGKVNAYFTDVDTLDISDAAARMIIKRWREAGWIEPLPRQKGDKGHKFKKVKRNNVTA